MDERLLSIQEYQGEGYRPLIDFDSWRVAILRWEQGLEAAEIATLERHTETDEVFVLLQGCATLLIGGNQELGTEIQPVVMDGGKLYNVKKDTWHAALLSRDAAILIVENRFTGVANTEFFQLTAEQRSLISRMEVHKQEPI